MEMSKLDVVLKVNGWYDSLTYKDVLEEEMLERKPER